MQIVINGKPLSVSWKEIILAIIVTAGSFTAGATYPELNPKKLFESSCDG